MVGGPGVDDLLAKFDGRAGPSLLPSTSDCGCDGELDRCEREPTVEVGEGGARESVCFPSAVLERLSSGGAFNKDVEAFSFSFPFMPFRLYHLSFPTPLLFGDVGSTKGLSGTVEAPSCLPSSWVDETLAGDGELPDVDEFVETIETASSKGFLSPELPLILTEGTCRKEWNSPPCGFWVGCWGIGGGGGKSWGGRLSFE